MAKLDEKIQELKDKTDPQIKRDLKAYSQTKNLVTNKALRTLMLTNNQVAGFNLDSSMWW